MTENNVKWDTISIVIVGRGGMGAVTASEIIAEAAYLSGNFVDVLAYPTFGTERRGIHTGQYRKLVRLFRKRGLQYPEGLRNKKDLFRR